MTNPTAEAELLGLMQSRDELTEQDLLRVTFHQEMLWGSFCVEENQGIISATPITAAFILLNQCITCITIENRENNVP